MTIRLNRYGRNFPEVIAYNNGFLIAGAFIPEDVISESSFEQGYEDLYPWGNFSPVVRANVPSGPAVLTLRFEIDQYTAYQSDYILPKEDHVQW